RDDLGGLARPFVGYPVTFGQRWSPDALKLARINQKMLEALIARVSDGGRDHVDRLVQRNQAGGRVGGIAFVRFEVLRWRIRRFQWKPRSGSAQRYSKCSAPLSRPSKARVSHRSTATSVLRARS